MKSRRSLVILVALQLALAGAAPAQASNRWDVLKWCTTSTPMDRGRCEGFVGAALDLMTSDDFSGPKSCFPPGTHLSDVRMGVVDWLKENKTAPEKSGLGLVTRAMKERFPCSNE